MYVCAWTYRRILCRLHINPGGDPVYREHTCSSLSLGCCPVGHADGAIATGRLEHEPMSSALRLMMSLL